MVRTASHLPLLLEAGAELVRGSRIARGRSPRGQVSCASSNSWKGRSPTASVVAMRWKPSVPRLARPRPAWPTSTRRTPTAPGPSPRSPGGVAARGRGRGAAHRPRQPRAGLGEEGWYGDVLVLVGEEVSPPGQQPLPGVRPEGADRAARACTPAEICRAVRDAGGFGFAAHPFSPGQPPPSRAWPRECPVRRPRLRWTASRCGAWSPTPRSRSRGWLDALRFVARPERA